VLASQLGQTLSVAHGRGRGQLLLDLLGALERVGQSFPEAQLCFSYFCRKRSTRPAVSMSFCFPVKNG